MRRWKSLGTDCQTEISAQLRVAWQVTYTTRRPALMVSIVAACSRCSQLFARYLCWDAGRAVTRVRLGVDGWQSVDGTLRSGHDWTRQLTLLTAWYASRCSLEVNLSVWDTYDLRFSGSRHSNCTMTVEHENWQMRSWRSRLKTTTDNKTSNVQCRCPYFTGYLQVSLVEHAHVG